MSSGSKLEDLNLTSDEIDRFSKAFKDEKFRELLHEYAEEISNPQNKKKYEEEITMMEQERGMDVKFIHPQPGHALKTSVNGAHKCFVNICSNDLLSKPVCKPGKAGDGKAGQLWSLPYSLAPGREDMGAKADRYMVYDVVFHPDTLYMAGRNDRFKKMVDETAIEAIQKQFNVKLDKKNTKTLKTKYKGAPHPTVIRKPLPGAKEAKPSSEPNDEGALQFPYPYGSNTHSAAGNGVEDSRNEAGNAKSKTKLDSDEQNKPTTPTHAIKYRTFVDFQDYRYSRDSAPSTRPRELVITIDLPLLKCAGDADLDVTENRFLLQSQKPAYKLDFPLPYPVNENQGTATFIKARKQLVVTLPVLPAVPEASSQAVCEVQSEPDGTVEEDLSDSNGTGGCRSCDTILACDAQVHDNLRTPANKNTSELPAFPAGGVARGGEVERSEDSLEVSYSDGEKSLSYESDEAQPITPVKKSEVTAGTAHYCDALPNHLQTRVKAEASEKSLEDCPSESEPRCPTFHLSQDNTSVTLFIDIKGIVRESFNSVLTATAYKVTFGTSELEKASYSLVLQFPPECCLQSSHSAAAVCEHSAPVSVCEHSAPVSVCEHSAPVSVCEHSAPVSVCEHSAPVSVCEHSAPVSVCEHSAPVSVCEHSAPVSVCEHSAPVSVCEHGAPVSVCEHSAPVSVVLSKSSQSVGLWQTFRFGITERDLQERSFSNMETTNALKPPVDTQTSLNSHAASEVFPKDNLETQPEPGICFQSQNKYNVVLNETPKAVSVVMSNPSGNVNNEGSSSGALTQETGQEGHTHRAEGLANSDTAITPGSQIANGKGPVLTNSSATANPPAVPNTMDGATPRELVSVSSDSPPHDAALDAGTANTAQKVVRLEERVTLGDGSELDEDDLPAEQKEGSVDCVSAPPVIEETNKDGSVTIISNHTTCSAFSFQNSLLFELD
ncbi:protein kintoun-like [Acipenser oxyrinchus oxyrinchus]|uniref:Protein kintoun n=1 Tax=Acipenser oxyrinchus oxyrinchus TaxID=40147 RepID=A0AAD8CXU8_ACIOX|nr:protein kintoun-like [Acipenser oxyrinchus oxyrinchus]